MQNKCWKQRLLCILCVVLIAVTALLTGCQAPPTAPSETPESATVLGEGKTVFYFIAVDLDGKETSFEVHTDETMVGAALMQVGLIQGEDSTYGLYVKTVNGLTLDYDTDGKYWAFFENGEYADSGVDTTEIKEGVTYAFKPL